MDSSSEPERTGTAARRRSGRAKKTPERFTAALPQATKRKRGETYGKVDAEGDDDDDEEEEEDDDEDDEDEDEPDEEELKERRRAAQRKRKAEKINKPAKKKAKQVANGQSISLAIRPAAATRSRKSKKTKGGQGEIEDAADGLYAEVFARGSSLDDVADAWVEKFKANESVEMADLFNLILKGAGCEQKIENHDVEDPDHFSEKLNELQEEYTAEGITEYPLIAKSRAATSFRRTFTEFFNCLTRSLARANILFDEPMVMDVMTAWISSMSSAGNRPFRHTATVAALAIVTALCEIARGIVDNRAKIQRQAEGEKKKGRVNKARVVELEKQVQKAQKQQETLEHLMHSWFDTVFVHRYRDIDPKIRVDCAAALGDWSVIYQDVFFQGQYLRYLGWVLSDEKAPIRHEVVKVLIKLYKDPDKLSGLRMFSERFRPRMIEMATMDHDPGVRAVTIELLDVLRDAGFLEPDDIDAIGRMIFDSESRVRKAVVPFFVANINDVYESKVEDLGGFEAIEEVLNGGESSADDFDAPRIEWLKLKALAEIMETYDAQDEIEPQNKMDISTDDAYLLVSYGLGSRFSQAAELLCDKVPELKQWEVLSGYLLYDHSAQANGVNETDTEALFKEGVKLGEKEEILLLEVLHSAVKLSLTKTVESGPEMKGVLATKKKPLTKKQREEAEEAEETATKHLAQLIPRLLNKFGAVPDAAYAVLRLEHVLNLEIFQELRQDLGSYSKLLDDIKKQFMSHSKTSVVEEASRALLHAKRFEDLEEITEEKVQGLWEDTIGVFNVLARDKGLTLRGNLNEHTLNALSQTVLRIRKLAEIADPTAYLEQEPAATTRGKTAAPSQPAISTIIGIISRALPSSEDDGDIETQGKEDELALNAASLSLQYFIWKIRSFREMVESNGTVPFRLLEACARHRDAFESNHVNILRRRHGADDVRVSIAGTLLDMFVLFQTLSSAKSSHLSRQQRQSEGDEDTLEQPDAYLEFCLEVPAATQTLLLQILTATEKAFAKRSRKTLEDDLTEDPVDTDEEPESDVEDEDDQDGDGQEAAKESRLKATMLSEQRLCSYAGRLVLGLLAGVLDGKKEGQKIKDAEGVEVGQVAHRLRRNYKRLGPNFKAVIDWFDENRPGAKRWNKNKGARSAEQKKAAVVAAAEAAKEQRKSEPMVLEEDDIEDEDEQEQNDEEMIAAEEEERQQAAEAEEADMQDNEPADEAESVVGD